MRGAAGSGAGAVVKSVVKSAAPSAFAIDFQQRRRAPSVLGWLLLASGTAAAAAVTYAYLGNDQALAVRQDQVARLEQRLRQSRNAELARRDDPTLAKDLAQAGGLARELTRDWGALLAQVERAGDTSVALLALEQDGTKGELRLEGVAKDLTSVFEFSRRLEGGSLSGARITGYEFRQDGAVRVVHFSLAARWEVSA